MADFFSAATTESAIRQLIADTAHAGGVRIRFLPGATYANLVKALDIMSYANQKKYWLDIRHYPTTLYAITTPPSQSKPAPTFSCGTRYLEGYPPPKKADFRKELTKFGKHTLLLLHEPWQAAALWLAILSSLSLGQLIRPEFSRHKL